MLLGLLVFAAAGAGLAVGTLARPSPTPPPTPTPRPPTPTPVPTTDPAVFRQPLASGCATEDSVWVVTRGGALLRWDGEHWAIADGTLRTLTAAACDQILYAVGPVGAVLIVDERARTVQSFDVQLNDLYGVWPLPDGVLAVGKSGSAMRLVGGSWQPYAAGITEDLRAVVAFSGDSAWVVGGQGASYRLEPAGWRPVPTGVDVTLRAVAAPNVGSALAAGDGGTLLEFANGRWTRLETGVTTPLRAIAWREGGSWIVGDDGTVLVRPGARLQADPDVQRFDLGTTCDLVSAFVRRDEIWILGWDGGRGGVWRIRGGTIVERWGAC